MRVNVVQNMKKICGLNGQCLTNNFLASLISFSYHPGDYYKRSYNYVHDQ